MSTAALPIDRSVVRPYELSPEMGIVVQKYGGTSLADTEAIRRCAARVVNAHLDGHQVVVVVSAMGKTTDRLIDLAKSVSESPPRRELDQLLSTGEQVSAALMAMAIQQMGVDAISVTARTLGIQTSSVHCNAKIHSIDAATLRKNLDAGRVVVATGFQGMSVAGDITTLGRGGSDTTAVAIAAALGVTRGTGICEINTDVDGVYTADPRYVPDARVLSHVSYEEMVELASLGAGVLHTRSVLFGQLYNVPIHVRHSARPSEGTMIIPETSTSMSSMERPAVVGCALTPELGRISIRNLPNEPGIQARLFAGVAAVDIMVDDIIQNDATDRVDLSFTVEESNLAALRSGVQGVLDEIGQGEVSVEVGLAKVSAVGTGMQSHTGVAASMFQALGDAGITIANITTSEIKISCIVPREQGELALRVVHDAFGLGGAPGSEGRSIKVIESKTQPESG